MKIMFLLASLLFLAQECVQTNIEASPTLQEEGTIKVYVCSRGCYQYLLKTGSNLYFPTNLDDAFKQDNLPVIFTGELQSSKTMIRKPAPNDQPIPDFEARDILVKTMQKK